jgi:1,4-alpha-glucan branching enzyme
MSNRKEKSSTANASRTGNLSVPFVFHAPGARQVSVTGNFCDWSREGIPLSLTTDDEWKTTLRLTQGRYEYRFLVDGEWRDDPNARQVVPNAFGTQNGVLEVR